MYCECCILRPRLVLEPGITVTLHLQELQRCRDDLKKAHSEVEKQKAEVAKKEEELKSAAKANEKQEKEMKAEIDRLKDQLQKDKKELAKALEKTQQVILLKSISSIFVFALTSQVYFVCVMLGSTAHTESHWSKILRIS